MKKYILLICYFSLFFHGTAQFSDSLINEALKRYPMLEECMIPDFPDKVLCGTLNVYEDYHTEEGRKIPIEVVVLPAKIPNPVKSAFTLHWGGNGAGAKDKVWFFRPGGDSDHIRASRDVVLIDDRGTGASNIGCSAMDSIQPFSYAFLYQRDLILECLNEVKDKFRLDFYNTPGVVGDYDQVREWLGLDQFDFYGISYGTRVGLEYMRTHPEKLRTLTVQATCPPGFNYVNEMDISIQEQLEVLVDRCKKDSICNKYYPNFREELYGIRDRLVDEPFQFMYDLGNGKSKELTIDDLLFRRMVGHLIINGDIYGSIPMLIHQAYEGNFVPLIDAGSSFTLDMPVFLSMFCPEEIDRFEYNPTDADLFTQGAIAEEKKLACSLWPEMSTADWLNEPLTGNCPVLILTGENDANTPIRVGEQIKKTLPEISRHIIFPYQGHASSETSCRYDIISQFIESKSLHSLDTSCLSSIQPTPFLWEIDLPDSEFEKYSGSYSVEDPGKLLELFEQNGVYYLRDEFSKWTGAPQLLYKGNHTFGVVDCSHCNIVFEMDQDKVVQVKRIYGQTTVFQPAK